MSEQSFECFVCCQLFNEEKESEVCEATKASWLLKKPGS